MKVDGGIGNDLTKVAAQAREAEAAGCDHGIENRLVMCGLIWLPSPRMKRPCDAACRSHPICARFIGLRANATAMPVPSSTRSVVCEARSSGKNGSCAVSAVHIAS